MGPTVLMAGVVLLVIGGAGLLQSGAASHSKMRTAHRGWFVGQVVAGLLLVGVGVALILDALAEAS